MSSASFLTGAGLDSEEGELDRALDALDTALAASDSALDAAERALDALDASEEFGFAAKFRDCGDTEPPLASEPDADGLEIDGPLGLPLFAEADGLEAEADDPLGLDADDPLGLDADDPLGDEEGLDELSSELPDTSREATSLDA